MKMAGKCTVCFLYFFIYNVYGLKLDQVLILGRHNVRAPLNKNLERLSPYTWPTWSEDAGHLTSKGAFFEEHMGKYLINWLKSEELLPEACPNKDNTVFIYANTRQRTRESAKAFVKGGFENCNMSVFSLDSETMDPLFNPVFRNASRTDIITREMKDNIDRLHLNDIYLQLDDIINLKESSMCKIDNFCSFANHKNDILYEIGKEPNINGPLNYGNAIIDSFLMSYYQGMPIENVAWGKIQTPEQWNVVSAIAKENINVRFNGTVLAKEVAYPLLNYIYNILSNNTYKFTHLTGHDSNLLPVMVALGIKPYVLPGQIEITPIGSKLIFQKWTNKQNDYFLKIDYVYQNMTQLRNGIKVSKENPPQWVNMGIESCPADQNGFCSWKSFMNKLSSTIQ